MAQNNNTGLVSATLITTEIGNAPDRLTTATSPNTFGIAASVAGAVGATTSPLPAQAWTAATVYSPNQLFVYSQTLYEVTAQYTSGASFGATDLSNTVIVGAATSASAITPFSGGGQTSATQMNAGVNRISTTVGTAAPFDSVMLPASIPGTFCFVNNATANPIQVFGSGTDTVNGVLTTTGITQKDYSVDMYICGAAGLWVVESGEGYAGSLVTELAFDTITAHSGGGQGSAYQLVGDINRVTTVAAANDSVKLPTSVAGMDILVINHGANAMQVFGNGSDKIDDQTATVGVSQMPNSLVIYSCASAGNWYSDGLAVGFGGPGLQTTSYTNALTAHAGGGQGSAVLLPSMLNRVTTVVSNNDSVILVASVPGLQITVSNAAAANSLNVYPNGTDQINTLGTSAAFALAAGKTVAFFSTVVGQWHALLSA